MVPFESTTRDPGDVEINRRNVEKKPQVWTLRKEVKREEDEDGFVSRIVDILAEAEKY